MKKLAFLALFLSITSIVAANVSTRVCEADGNTLFDGRDIMVGTNLTIIVSSDVDDDYWPCDLAIKGTNRDYGVLSARDYNDITGHYDGSFLEAAGEDAYVFLWHDDILEVDGFSYTGEGNAGDWFIVDYNATDIGDCNVGFYEWWGSEPAYNLSFTHVRTRDFNNDTIVNFADFEIFTSHWQDIGCIGPNWCEGADLDTNGIVDGNDLELFVRYWLETTR